MPTSPIDKATLVDWMEWVRMASLGLYEINKRRGRRPLETFSDPATDPQTDTGIQMNRTEAVAATYFRELFARYLHHLPHSPPALQRTFPGHKSRFVV